MSEQTPKKFNWMLITPVIAIVGMIVLAWGFSSLIGSLFPEEKQDPQEYAQTPQPRHRLVKFPNRPTPVVKTAKKVAKTAPKPRKREWVGKPSKLPPHEVLMKRVRAKYRVNPNAPAIPKAGSDHFVLRRQDVKEWAALPLEKQGARYSPNLEYGRPRGLRITDLEPKSFIRRLGLYKDDVIMSINGRNVLAPGQAREFYHRAAHTARNLTISFRRGRKTHTIDFSMRKK